MFKLLSSFILILAFSAASVFAQSTLSCKQCHAKNDSLWVTSSHGKTQNDVASELSEEDVGKTPAEVIADENCIACHAPTAINANGGMTEAEALGNFFSTKNGVFTDSTIAADTANWPNVACVACHNVPDLHPNSAPPGLAIFNSFSAEYAPVSNSSELCGQCHGNLRFAGTDHLTMNAWKGSKHGHGGQADVASELSEENAGKTPAEVVADENCIACHAPTSVMNNSLTEADALGDFFTTVNGKFTSSTVPQDTSNYPEVACVTCHNPHKPGVRSYFNSSTKKYEVMSSAQELCGQCHGNLRFPGTDHLSYNIEEGTGGKGVTDLKTMPNIKCVDCHMHIGTVDGSNSAMYRGHTWKIFVKEDDGSESASCTVCHSTMTASMAYDSINLWKADFVKSDSIANIKVAAADSLLKGSSDSSKIHKLQEAQFNLAYAESDESGGVHNHKYTTSLLNNAIKNADDILTTGINDNFASNVRDFKLYPNFPNPFNNSTLITYQISKNSFVNLTVYNISGQQVAILVNENNATGKYSIRWNGIDGQGNNLSPGIYLCILKVNASYTIQKMLLVK